MRTLLIGLALLVSAPASAQVQQGLVELGGTASFTSTEGLTVLTFSPTVGYFFTDALEAGVGLDYTKVEDFDGDGALAVFLAYHFGRRGATTVPFLSAQIGTSITDDSDLLFGGAGGAKFFFLPGGALTAQLQVLTSGDVTSVGAGAGVSIFF